MYDEPSKLFSLSSERRIKAISNRPARVCGVVSDSCRQTAATGITVPF